MRFRTVLFDLDGTLIDHFKAIHRCHSYAMRAIGLPEPTMAQVRAAVGGGLDHAIIKLAGRENLERLLPLFTEHWAKTNLQDVELLPGAAGLLTALRGAGVTTAVFTNKRGYAAREVCDFLKLTPLVAGVFGAEDTPWGKPDPAFTRYVLGRLGAEPATTLMVGDSPFDLATAVNGGLAFIGVTTGTHDAGELHAAGATQVVPGLPAVGTALGLA